jgi:hypothetical protein
MFSTNRRRQFLHCLPGSSPVFRFRIGLIGGLGTAAHGHSVLPQRVTSTLESNESTGLGGKSAVAAWEVSFDSSQPGGIPIVISRLNLTLNQATSGLAGLMLFVTPAIVQFCLIHSNYPYTAMLLSATSAPRTDFECLFFCQ